MLAFSRGPRSSLAGWTTIADPAGTESLGPLGSCLTPAVSHKILSNIENLRHGDATAVLHMRNCDKDVDATARLLTSFS